MIFDISRNSYLTDNGLLRWNEYESMSICHQVPFPLCHTYWPQSFRLFFSFVFCTFHMQNEYGNTCTLLGAQICQFGSGRQYPVSKSYKFWEDKEGKCSPKRREITTLRMVSRYSLANIDKPAFSELILWEIPIW